MMIKTTYILSMSLWIFLSGCSSDGISDKTFIKCEDSKRGDVCTQEYKPVCATSVDKSKISYKTISNGCTACLDYQVTGFTKGECETEGKVWSDKSTKVDINSYIDLPDPTKRKSSVSFLKMDLSEEQLDLLSYFANHSHLVSVQIKKAKNIEELKYASLDFINKFGLVTIMFSVGGYFKISLLSYCS